MTKQWTQSVSWWPFQVDFLLINVWKKKIEKLWNFRSINDHSIVVVVVVSWINETKNFLMCDILCLRLAIAAVRCRCLLIENDWLF
jgi:hypothetical protein